MRILYIPKSLSNFINIKNGALYNWHAYTDARNITSTGWHVPTYTETGTLSTFIGGFYVGGGKLKETGLVYFDTPNTGATNELGFNGRGAGHRSGVDGTFIDIKRYGTIMSTLLSGVNPAGRSFTYLDATISSYINATGKSSGEPIRPIKDSTTLSHGQTGFYVDPSGFVYRTICIGTQEWVADNIKTQHYRNGDAIPEVTDNTAWAALTTGALCAYNNDWANV